MNEMISFSDISQMARAIGASKMFGQTAEQTLALMLVAQAEGRHPAIVARDYHVIQGRPTLKADAMMARFHEAGGRVQWHGLTDRKAEATFSHPQGGEVRLSWTIEMASRAGLDSKPGPWRQYPRAMLRARLISEGIRTVFPGVVCGTYTPEEVVDFAPLGGAGSDMMEKDITPPQPEPLESFSSDPEPIMTVSVDDAVASVKLAWRRVGSKVFDLLKASGLPSTSKECMERPEFAAQVKEIADAC